MIIQQFVEGKMTLIEILTKWVETNLPDHIIIIRPKYPLADNYEYRVVAKFLYDFNQSHEWVWMWGAIDIYDNYVKTTIPTTTILASDPEFFDKVKSFCESFAIQVQQFLKTCPPETKYSLAE